MCKETDISNDGNIEEVTKTVVVDYKTVLKIGATVTGAILMYKLGYRRASKQAVARIKRTKRLSYERGYNTGATDMLLEIFELINHKGDKR